MIERRRALGIALAAALLALTFPAQAAPGAGPPAAVAAVATDYTPDSLTVKQGQILSFAHLDAVTGSSVHSLDQVVDGCEFPALSHPDPGDDGTCPARKFSAGLVPRGQVRNVPGVEQLPKGTYKFACRVHRPRMTGTLVVE
jgi:plastocyanin